MMRGTSWGDVRGLKYNAPAASPVRAKLLFPSIVFLLTLAAFPSYQPTGFVEGTAILSTSSDGEHLLALKHSITTCGSEGLLSDWDENGSDPCSWSGVRCDPDSQRVVSLRIEGKQQQTRRAGFIPSSETGVDLDDKVDCGLTGTLSPALGKLSELRRLSITHNGLTGELPKGIAGLKSLQVLDLRSNLLTGQIPSELGQLSNLRVLNLDDNAFQGSIPSELSSCHELRRLSLSGNVLSGSIPPSLGTLPRLQRLSLSGNSLVGSIPSHLFVSPGSGECRLVYFDLSGNRFSGSIPPEIGGCAELRWVFLNFNDLVGSIPGDLGRLTRLKSLQVAGNRLSGSVPPQLTGCTRLESLVLTSDHNWSSCLNRTEGNNFYGGIPPGLAFLPNLLVLWAPGAERAPEVVDREHFCNVYFHRGLRMDDRVVSPQAVLHRSPYIFSDALALSLSRRSVLTEQNSSQIELAASNGTRRKLNSIFVAAITSGCAIAIVLFSLGLIFQCSKFHKKKPPLPSQLQLQQQAGRKVVVTFMNTNPNLTFDNVVKATGNFSIDNLIGSGGFGATYKAEVKPGVLVAVKRLAIGRFQGAQQFDTEIRTLGRIRHPNLVTLIGYHVSREEMFLIYNFFSQGNLETLIHNHKEQMDWKTRHSIAFRIAEALAFLHDDCVPRVLHRDIKPSNILLDDNLNAHLSDFGLARLLGASETHATTDVAGTFGYVAPEYAMTCRVTDKADVYSYGVVLLELISGKKALDPSFCEYGDGFNIVTWACLLIRQGRAPEVFPTKLWELGPERNLLETLKLAVLCTVDQLHIRPTMKEVVDTLGKIRPGSSTT